MKASCEVAIIGAGVSGLAIAYELTQRGISDIVVLEKSYLGSGDSGRNGGGVRAQWTSAENIALAKGSIEAFRDFSRRLGYNIWFRQGGYLFLAFTAEEEATLERNAALQREHGVPTRMLSPQEIHELVPALGLSGIVAGAYHRGDGVLVPYPVLWGYLRAVQEAGVEVLPFTEVTGIDRESGRISGVRTTRGSLRATAVVDAAGPWSSEIAAMAGVKVPTQPFRHEILATEPLKPFLDPMVVTLSDGFYMSQTMRGELVGGLTVPGEPSHSWDSSLEFLRRFARRAVELFPRLAAVRVQRQWAGSYDVSPDHNAILGDVPERPGLYLACGYSGHGFMISPMVGRLLAELIATGRTPALLEPYHLSRFGTAERAEETLVIG